MTIIVAIVINNNTDNNDSEDNNNSYNNNTYNSHYKYNNNKYYYYYYYYYYYANSQAMGSHLLGQCQVVSSTTCTAIVIATIIAVPATCLSWGEVDGACSTWCS